MASLSHDNGGTWRIIFRRPIDGKRAAIRLGAMPRKTARTVLANIEAIIASVRSATSFADEVATWVASIGTDLHADLVKHGLINARVRMRLAKFLADYRQRRGDVKPQTRVNYRTCINRMLAFFDGERFIHEITAGDADRWFVWLKEKGYAKATIGKTITTARQFFRDAIRSGMIARNPFADIKAPGQTNRERIVFVSRQTIAKVIEAAPDAEWRLIIALSRYGGLRCPSEHLAVTWRDVNWETQRVRIQAPKTGERFIPIFPELKPFLEESFAKAPAGSVYLIERFRTPTVNMRTQFQRIIARAGVESWPRLFHNLRASRQTELEDSFPGHVVCAWLGNNETTASKHYLKVRDDHFIQATLPNDVAQKAARTGAESDGKAQNQAGETMDDSPVFAGKNEDLDAQKVTPTGCESDGASPIPINNLHPNTIPGGAQSGAQWPWDRDIHAERDAKLMALHIQAHMQGDIE